LELESARRVYDALYKGVDGYGIWDRNRWFHKEHLESLGYGEVGPDGFLDALRRAAPQPGEVFYDLGSGTGKAVFLAAMLFDFKKAVGIELMDSLGLVARKLLAKYDATYRPEMPEAQQHQELAFIDGSFLEKDFSDADVVFTHSTLFSPPLWDKLVARMESLKPGARVVCATKDITSEAFELKEDFRVVMPWGAPHMKLYVRR
jgi:SAM-dependent methyltransferase